MASQENLNELATKPIGRLLWDYSLPGVVGMLVMALYNVVDRIFIGQVVGPEAIAGLAVTFPLMNITTAIGVLVGVGSSSWVSILLGQRDFQRAHLMLGNAMTLTLINAAIYIAVFAVWMSPILRAFGAGDVTLPYARTYMLWVLPGLLLTNIAFGFNNIMRASGYPVKAMFTMLIGAVTNIALDALFVLGFGWGMVGAAVATNIAMAVSALFVMWHFFRPDVTLRFRRGTFRLRWDVITQIISVGAAPSLINIAACLINILINKSLLAHGGDMAIGAAGIFVTYTSLLTTVILGICMGLQPPQSLMARRRGIHSHMRCGQHLRHAMAFGNRPCVHIRRLPNRRVIQLPAALPLGIRHRRVPDNRHHVFPKPRLIGQSDIPQPYPPGNIPYPVAALAPVVHGR